MTPNNFCRNSRFRQFRWMSGLIDKNLKSRTQPKLLKKVQDVFVLHILPGNIHRLKMSVSDMQHLTSYIFLYNFHFIRQKMLCDCVMKIAGQIHPGQDGNQSQGSLHTLSHTPMSLGSSQSSQSPHWNVFLESKRKPTQKETHIDTERTY